MPIDIRYHAVSLLAVFLALVLGILVGFALVEPGQMKRFVQEVKKDNEKTRLAKLEELESLRQQHKASQTFENLLLPLVLEDRLQNRRILLLLDSDRRKDSPASRLREVLETAGAEVTAVVTLNSRLGRLKNEEIARLLAGRGIPAPPADVDPRTFLARRIGQRMVEGGTDLPSYLEEEGLLRLSSRSDFSRPVGTVVVVGSQTVDSEFADRIEEPMLQAMQQVGQRVIGCELSGDSGDAVELFQHLKLSTVDCVDTYPGQAALVLVVAGAEGHFGMKQTAERLLPDLQ